MPAKIVPAKPGEMLLGGSGVILIPRSKPSAPKQTDFAAKPPPSEKGQVTPNSHSPRRVGAVDTAPTTIESS
jgi:hypothetical protein